MNELQRQVEADRAKNRQILDQLTKQVRQCSRCGGSWTLDKRRGICQHCGKPSEAKTTKATPRQLKSNRRQKRRQADNSNNGYHQLCDQQGWIATNEGFKWATIPWATLYNVASRYAVKALAQDRQDLLHDILIGLATVAKRKTATGQDFTEPAMHRVAEHIKDWYWYKRYAYTNGLDCGHCSKEQRAKCRYNWGHSEWAYCDCHRAIQLESLNRPIIDNEGNETELAQLIADDKALDLEEWTDARTFLIGAPIRLKAIAMKVSKGEKLSQPEHCYLYRLRQKQQIALV